MSVHGGGVETSALDVVLEPCSLEMLRNLKVNKNCAPCQPKMGFPLARTQKTLKWGNTGSKISSIGNQEEFLVNGVTDVTDAQLEGKMWNSLFNLC